METLDVHKNSESTAHEDQRPIVVALGASNLSRGLSRLLQASRCCSSSAFDLVVAAGHGRSYGVNSRIWNRNLPSILESGLWRSIDKMLRRDVFGNSPRLAVITDIGNDLLYGFSIEQIATWLEEVIHRLHLQQFNIVITKLPIESIQSVGPRRFRLLKTFFVPGCRQSLEEIKEQSRQMNNSIVRLAKKYQLSIIEQPGFWYGLDAIHIRRSCLDDLWQRVVECWPVCTHDSETRQGTAQWSTWKEWFRIGAASAEVRSLAGVMLFTPQPVFQLGDTTRVFLY
jgi:hypothetical protein